jgi:hypothetical protein
MAKRLKQQIIPGAELPKIVAIERAAEEFVEVRNERMGLTKKEKEARLVVEALMREHELDSYEFDGQIINIEKTAKAVVRVKKDPESNGDGENVEGDSDE